MEIALRPEHQKILEDQLGSGRYRDLSEVVAEALELLRDRDQTNQETEELRQAVRKGFAQVEAGEYISISSDEEADQFAEEIHRRGLQKLAAGERRKRLT